MTNIQSSFWKKSSYNYSKKKTNSFLSWKIKHGSSFFKKILKITKPKSILEVGSNIGLNIHYIRQIDKDKKIKIDAIEINEKVASVLSSKKFLKVNSVINDDFLTYKSKNKYDLVYTVGVLIHISPKNINKAINKIISMSKKYILVVEYFSHKPVEVKNYKGKKNLLFKRDFGKLFNDKKNLICVDYGFLWQEKEKVFDNLNWWIFKKK
jgi:pseudaminic acid biosynthesis-associated methylase